MLFLTQIIDLPQPFSQESADNGISDLLSQAKNCNVDNLSTFTQHLSKNQIGHDLLAAVFGNSPFLSRCIIRDIAFFKELMELGPFETSKKILINLHSEKFADRSGLMQYLRRVRNRVALMTALSDIAKIWSLADVTHMLSSFADGAVSAAVDHLIGEAVSREEIAFHSAASLSEGSGFFIIGMGKLGANELNYSSDIDLVAFYDENRIGYTGAKTPQEFCSRLTRDLVKILQSRTRDGYVFRTDLRLRPDTGSSPLSISADAAESYYEAFGQNWERAALIKARIIAGDLSAGRDFLKRMTPFVWRKYLDFSAINDIHSIKRQIHAQRGHNSVTVPGHNLKLGRGGIREIEFFTQTQQLIAGGRDPSLRSPETCKALRALHAAGRINQKVADDLVTAYLDLRRIEHRLQMISDEQTHSIPHSISGINQIANFLGYMQPELFEEQTLKTLRSVEKHYSRLFEHSPALADSGSLVFTGGEDDPDTIDTLRGLGFQNPSIITTLIRNWHHGHFRAMRSARARELLTELTPLLLKQFSRTADPDQALLKFDTFLEKLPAGIQIFSLFHSNPSLLELVSEIMGSAPKLADHLAHNSRLLDNVLNNDFYHPVPNISLLAKQLDDILTYASHYEETLDITRRWGQDQAFQIGVHILCGISTASDIGPKMSAVADVILNALFKRTEIEFSYRHGRIPGASFAIIALGKYGSMELIPESDLDLTFIYDCPLGTEKSDGTKPLSAPDYFSRLSKRVLNSLSALTSEGRLYEVDMRLRPLGSAGPIAVHLASFRDYQRDQAWCWEHMALTKARIVVGAPSINQRIETVIKSVLRMPRNPTVLLENVSAMRETIKKKHGTKPLWHIKHTAGGLLDIEFICQYLILENAYCYPNIVNISYYNALRFMADRGLLPEAISEDLCSASELLRNAQGFLRQTVKGTFIEDETTQIIQQSMARALGFSDFIALNTRIVQAQGRVRQIYQDLIQKKIPNELQQQIPKIQN